MAIFKTPIKKKIARKFKEIENKVKNSFTFIRQDISEMQSSNNLMKKYLKKQKKQNEYAKKQDNKLRAEFRRDVDEFSQKTKQLSLVLSQIKELRKELVIKGDLAKIEEKISDEFRNKIKELEKQLKKVKKGKIKPSRRWFWWQKKQDDLDTEEESLL